ncbi:MAG: lytic murein transglycosylase B [Gammaproteobacteria bacterium]
MNRIRYRSALTAISAACLLAGCAHMVKPARVRPASPAAVQKASIPAPPAPYTARPEVQQFIDRLVQQDGFDKNWLEKTLAAAQPHDSILAAIAKPYEAKPWYQYKPLFVTPARINAGVAFWDAHAALLTKAQQQYGVPASIIVSILGVESFYGRQKGGYPVLNALATLSFDYPPRAGFFQGELEQYLLMCREHGFDPPSLMGSYAGAMGAPQFMPDSYRQYAVTFDGKGSPDIWSNWADIIGSVANYFHIHGWQPDDLVAVPAALSAVVTKIPATLAPTTVGVLRSGGVVVSHGLADNTPAMLVPLELADSTEYWVGLHNFRVILQYNRSPLYAMAVYDLATRITEARALEGQSAPP